MDTPVKKSRQSGLSLGVAAAMASAKGRIVYSPVSKPIGYAVSRQVRKGGSPKSSYHPDTLRRHFQTSKYFPHHGDNVSYKTIVGVDGKVQGISRHGLSRAEIAAKHAPKPKRRRKSILDGL